MTSCLGYLIEWEFLTSKELQIHCRWKLQKLVQPVQTHRSRYQHHQVRSQSCSFLEQSEILSRLPPKTQKWLKKNVGYSSLSFGLVLVDRYVQHCSFEFVTLSGVCGISAVVWGCNSSSIRHELIDVYKSMQTLQETDSCITTRYLGRHNMRLPCSCE